MDKNEMTYSNNSNREAIVEQALWDALLQADEVHCSWDSEAPLTEDMISVDEVPNARISYPWNPAHPEAEAFFANAEQESVFDGWQPGEISAQAAAFFNQIDSLWSDASLAEKLAQRFAKVPREFLATIAAQAQQAVSESRSLADQLVQCVQEVLPLRELVTEDLYVLARPLAYSMRDGNDPVDATLASVRDENWTTLSEVEQARLSLAAASYALEELKKS